MSRTFQNYVYFIFIYFFCVFNFLLRATPILPVDIKQITCYKKYLSIYCSEVLLQIKILTIAHTIQYLGGWGGGVNFNNHLLALLHTNIQEILWPLSRLFLKMCCICVLFTGRKFPVTDKIMCGSRKYPYLSPPPRIFHSSASLRTHLPPGISRIFEQGLLTTLRNSKWFQFFKKKKVNTNSVMKYNRILLQQCKLLSSLLFQLN